MVTRNGGEWTEARFNSFVKSALRAASRRWPPKYKCLSDAFIGSQINLKSGRMAKHYKCAKCLGAFPSKDVQVDHIIPIIDPEVGFVDWNTVVENMFCEKHNLQVLCKPCHKLKSDAEKAIAKERKNERKSK